MKELLKKLVPLSFRLLILRCLNYFPERHPLSLPLPHPLESGQMEKAALISYVTAPFKEGSGSTLLLRRGFPKLMVRALHSLGYSVDVVEWSNTVFTPHKDYQLFIGHAGRNFERLSKRLQSELRANLFFDRNVLAGTQPRRRRAFRCIGTAAREAAAL